MALAQILICASCVCAQSNDTGRFLRWVAQDVGILANTVGPFVPAILVGSTATVNSFSSIDRRISASAHSAIGPELPRTLRWSNYAGGPKATVFAAATFGATLLTRNPRLQDAAFTSFQSLLLAGGISYSLKYSLGRTRPYHGFDPDDFRPYSGNTSFPSGHTTAVFALVTPWLYYYRHPATYALFGVASATAMARVAAEHHWPTDVVAGAALGFFTARFLSKRHLRQGSGVSFTPFASTNGVQIRMGYRF